MIHGALTRILAAALMVAAILLLAPRARSHDWYEPYTNPNGASCCGGRDCHRLPKSDVRQVKTGYAVKLGEQEIIVPFEQAQPSEDEDFHICIWGGAPQCFFAPPMGV